MKQPKLGSPATSSQPSSHEMNFPMPRLASPAIPNIHSIGGLSSLHLQMQQHNLTNNLSGNGDLISNRTRNRSNDSRTPPHTETSKHCHAEPMGRSEKTARHSNTMEQQLKHLSKSTSSSNNNNNNNNKETSVRPFHPNGIQLKYSSQDIPNAYQHFPAEYQYILVLFSEVLLKVFKFRYGKC